MDAFSKYDNTAGFFVGNEVITTSNGSVAAPFIKAATRDIKAYQATQSYRKVPIGYSAADIAELRPMLQDYLACGNDSETLDYFALNAYEWCGSDTTYQVSGYASLTNQIQDYPIPIFFSETGCITARPRTFADQSAIFGDEMSPYWSGAIAYEWIEEANNYGIVSYGPKVDPAGPNAPPDGFTRSGTPTPISPDFTNLQNQWKTVSPSSVMMSAYSPSVTGVDCPAFTQSVWVVQPSDALPTLGQTFEAQASATASAGGSGGSGSGSSGGTSGSATGGAASASSTPGAASPAREVAGGAIGMVGLAAGFLWWL
ncbi:hypothetical protein LTS18_008769 [Coniosporium uncinatum]|uniref:Uncharacterized protein n=1 Tax=Coniosporium uncinatum TaxID=93489 RepID=A0ACC3DN05_9PEZI|nr:hypothetical protein LTS18_008769 [Coniosporium uncinatum]